MKKTLVTIVSILITITAITTILKADEKADETELSESRHVSHWYIGFGIGYADGSYERDGERVTFDETSEISTDSRGTLNFGVGGILTEKIHLGVNFSAIVNRSLGTYGGYNYESNVYNYNFLGMLTVFPFFKYQFFRLGFGATRLMAEMSYSDETYWQQVWGYGGLVGIGFALPLGRSFNICINADFSYYGYEKRDTVPETGMFWSVYISFYWF